MGLRIAGLMMTGLVVANFVAAKRWGYAENLAGTTTIIRQVFYVHCGYIVLLISALAVLCLVWPQRFLEPGMGRLVSGFFGVFWGSRVVVQLCYYDPEERRRHRGWDVFFFGIFGYLGVIFVLACVIQ